MSEHADETAVEDDRMDVIVCGVKIGTADGWDNYNETGMQFNSFEPNEKFKKFFWGNDIEIDNLCIDMHSDGIAMLVGYLDQEEVPFNMKDFLKLIVEQL